MAKTIKVVDVSSADAMKDEEVEHVEPAVESVGEVKPEVEPESEKRTIKTVELFECEKCGKKLTARTLKYAHASKCPQQVQTPKPTTLKPERKQPERETVIAKEPEPKPILTAYEERMLKIRERQEKIRQLASQAF